MTCIDEYMEEIKLNNHITAKLPYILIPEIKSKFLIDTGASRSMISTNKVNEYFYDQVRYEPFTVQTAHAKTQHDYVIKIPSIKTFRASHQIHKFHVFDFSDKYDGLIGINLLEQLGANVDIANRVLKTKFGNIKIHFEENKIKIGPRQRKIVRIPVTRNNDHIIVNHQAIVPGVEVPTSITTARDFEAITEIINFNEHTVELNLVEPLTSEIYEEDLIPGEDTTFTSQQIDQIQYENVTSKLRLNHLNKEERMAMLELCTKYKDICYDSRLPLTFTNEVKHELRMTDETPIYMKPYRKPPAQKAEIKSQVNKLLQQDIIQESHSPWSAPVSIVPKKMDASGEIKYRMVIDYRRLNENTIDDKYPIPNIADILDKLGRAQYFTTLDLASGYHQIEMHEKDVQKTAFSTEQGHYEFKRMAFGMKNAPATFQRVMDNVLRGLQDEICHVYLDDIIVYSTSLQEHIDKLEKVFTRLRKANFKIQLDKCEFLQKEVAYLGHIITKHGVQPNPDKIEAIKKYPLPRTTKEIKSFLGLLGYYRKFIKDFAKMTKPLTKCLKKKSKIVINEEYRSTFERCKKILMNKPILQYPDFSKSFILTTDASNVALGAVLSQGNLGSDKPICYASRTLSETEQKYSTIEKELLAIVWATKYFRPYLYGRKFTIYTDHRPLVWLSSLKEPNSKLARWKIKLEEYNFEVIYKKGKYNTNADALSRIKLNALETSSMQGNAGESAKELLEDLPTDEELLTIAQEVLDRLTEEETDDTDMADEPSTSGKQRKEINDTVHSNVNEEPRHSIPCMDEAIDIRTPQYHIEWTYLPQNRITFQQNQGKKIYKVQIPKEDNEEQIFQFMRDYMSQSKHYLWFKQEQLYKDFCKIYIQKFGNNGPKLYRCMLKLRVVETKDEQNELIRQNHEGKRNHRGINETLKQLQRKYFWQNMKETISIYIKKCEICNRNKYDRQQPHPPLNITEQVNTPFEKIHIDVFTIGSQQFLTIVDAFSKLGQAINIASKNAVEIADALITYFSLYGVPEQIVADGGLEFNNEVIQELLEKHKIKFHICTPRNPNSNGNIERLHSTLIEHIRILRAKDKDEPITKLMKLAIIAYNSSIHATTKLTPLEITYGHTKLKDPFEMYYNERFYSEYVKEHANRLKILYENLGQEMQGEKEKIIGKRNEKAKIRPFEVNQEVYMRKVSKRNKLTEVFEGPFTIKIIHNDNTAIVSDEKNKERKVHMKNLRHGIIPENTDALSMEQEET